MKRVLGSLVVLVACLTFATALGDYGYYFKASDAKHSDGSKPYLHWEPSVAEKHKAEVSLEFKWLEPGEYDGPRVDIHSPKFILVRAGCVCADIVEENKPKFTNGTSFSVCGDKGSVIYVPMSLPHVIRTCEYDEHSCPATQYAHYASYFPKSTKALFFPEAFRDFGKLALTSHFNLKYELVKEIVGAPSYA